MTEEELYYAALARAPHHGMTREVAALYDGLMSAAMRGQIDLAAQGRLADLFHAIYLAQRPQVGDLISGNATDIFWDVLEVEDSQGDVWRRAFGRDRYAVEDVTGEIDYSEEYDWVTVGGWSTTDGLLLYAPLTVIKVAVHP
jgi:hypothetical protein